MNILFSSTEILFGSLWIFCTYRSSRRKAFCKKTFPKNLLNFKEKLCSSLFFNKGAGCRPEILSETLTQVIFIELREFFSEQLFHRTPVTLVCTNTIVVIKIFLKANKQQQVKLCPKGLYNFLYYFCSAQKTFCGLKKPVELNN